MPSEGGINGTAVFAALVGSIMLYSGVKGKAISSTIKSLIEGKNPSDVPQSNPITGTTVAPTPTGTTPFTTTDTPGPLVSSGAGYQGIMTFLKGQHFSNAATAGIMGNMQAESSFNTGALNAGEAAIGICQWEGGRRTHLKSYAAAHGGSETDLTIQLNFMMLELNTSYAHAQLVVRGSPTPELAAAAFDALYEVSAGTSRQKREQYARQIYNTMR